MTKKRERNQVAKILRKNIAGLKLPASVQVAKVILEKYGVIPDLHAVLEKNGYNSETIVTSYCPTDGGAIGYIAVFKSDIPVGKIFFDCGGLCYPECI